MLNGFEHGLQIFARALGTARQIDDQARAANAAVRDRTRHRRNLHGRCPHGLRDTRRELFADLMVAPALHRAVQPVPPVVMSASFSSSAAWMSARLIRGCSSGSTRPHRLRSLPARADSDGRAAQILPPPRKRPVADCINFSSQWANTVRPTEYDSVTHLRRQCG